MQKRFDLLICDLDGTLIDNRIAIRENFNYALQKKGYRPVEDRTIDSMIGVPLEEMFERVLPDEHRQYAKELVNIFRERYVDTSHHGVVILDGVVPTLEALKS